MPDWVFNTDTMTFSTKDLEEQKKKRPSLILDFAEVKWGKSQYWNIFRKYHYLDHGYHEASRLFLCYVNGSLAGFFSYLHYPHPRAKNIKKAHRVVIFPDYQGVGIAKAGMEYTAKFLAREGFLVRLTTSNSAMVNCLKKSVSWKCIRLGRNDKNKPILMSSFKRTNSCNRITAQFEYNG